MVSHPEGQGVSGGELMEQKAKYRIISTVLGFWNYHAQRKVGPLWITFYKTDYKDYARKAILDHAKKVMLFDQCGEEIL
jgi:hypothetical protein